jgi:predicted nucleic acid-binding protein
MNLTVLVDTFAWIEYFKGSQKRIAVKKLIDGTEPLLVSTINLAEVFIKEANERGEKIANERVKFIMERCEVVSLDDGIAILAAKEKLSSKLGLADAIIYATAKIKKAKIITGDQHFKDFEDVIFLK